ncbi:MAG: LPS assembly protein LptD [Methylococcaceae bacterium]|nr:LPS assembly protein LptD [Methylococcaceae bacterium]MDD1615704.1 LPS assembly protein LptD [Methylococcaceae bacterium]OYV19665.1 MAG: LPS-assembly protein [Methylococcaceae bacterium NSP1-2]
MHRRLSLVFLPLLYAPISFANDSAWDCEQNKDTKEWLCVGDEKPSTKTDNSNFPTESLPAKRIQPALVEPNDEPDEAPVTVQRTKPNYDVVNEAPATVQRTKPNYDVVNEAPATAQRTKPNYDVVNEAPATAQRTKPNDEPVVNEAPATAQRTKPDDEPVVDENAQATESATSEKDESSESASSPIHLPTSDRVKPPSSVATKYSGWNCDGDNQDDNWNCQLVGTDPKGQARPVKALNANTYEMRLLDPAFDTTQEQTFETLTSKLPYDPWEICDSPQKVKPVFVSKKGSRETAPLELTSDFGEIFDNEIGRYLGNVEINRGDQHSLSHIANYDSVSQTLDLNGDVYYNEEELALYGRSASMKLASDQSKLRDALFISPATHLRGSSKVVYRDSKTFSRYKDVAYTSCRPGNQDWVLHASELKLNDVTGKGAVKNAWVEFKGVPVFYTPYLSFPTDDRRTTGFLPPSLHYTQQAGVGIYTPYYWNIAPNYDATFTPRYLTNRGLLLGGDFRYLTEMTKGAVKFEYLPNDTQLHKPRYLGAVTNQTVFTPHISSNVDLNYISDKNYFSELGNALSLPNFSYLRSAADVSYIREGVSLVARADNYQAVTSAPTVLPYRRLPQINLNLNHSFKTVVPIDVATESESVYFQHGDQVNGERLNIKPSVSIPFQTASAFITPKLSLQHTEYFLSKQAVAGSPGNISRTLPIASLDSGMFFEKNVNLGGSPMLHTLEPRLFYLYIPYKDQRNIPLFDTAQYDFVFASLFRENRFAGLDRIQDANQLSVALTSRLVDSSTGQEKLKLSIGDILYFQDRKVTANTPVETNFTSPIIAELSSQLTDHISVDTGLQWDPSVKDTTQGKYISQFTRGKAAIHFINQPNEIINAGYYYRKNPQIPDRQDDIIQSDVSAHWPIYDDWSVVGRWQYSMLYNRTQEGFFGVEKENCCWRFRVIGRHYLSSIVNDTGLVAAGTNQSIAQGKAQNGIFFQIELKGLTGIGERLDTFFEKNIYGYRRSDQ